MADKGDPSGLDALLSQINPHFLYNTLDCIRGQALLDKNEEIADMVGTLSLFFRYSISRRGNLVTLGDEIENVKRYMKIQNYRFPGRYLLAVRIDEEDRILMEHYIPKLSIQPLVENAVFHGLESKGSGTVTIDVEATRERLYLTVGDDGCGMTPKTLGRIRRELAGRSDDRADAGVSGQTGIALANIHRRIRMMFGEEYGLQIYSVEGRGTDVELLLPRIQEKEERD